MMRRPPSSTPLSLHDALPIFAVGESVERWHALAGPPAFDGGHEPLAVEPRGPQVRPVRHLRVHLATVCRPAVTRLTVSLLSIRSEEHTSELQSPCNLVCRLLL